MQFNFSDDWEEYGKTVVFQMASYYQIKTGVDGKERLVTVAAQDAVPYEQILVGNEATVPWEVLVHPGFLKIGIYGSLGDSVKPTVWAKTVQVWPGVSTDNENPAPPTPSSYEILAGLLSGGRAGQYIYKNSDSDLDFAWNALPKGDKGDTGDQGEPGVGIASVVFNADTSVTFNLDDGTSYTTDPLKGEKGDTGSKGDTGDTGKGISSIVENNDTSLTFYLTDESTFTTSALKGDKGDKGNTGAAGNGISNIVMNNDYTLTINFDDGTYYTTAPIRGATGATGATGNGIDHIYLNPNYTLSIFYTDGTSMTTTSIRGEKGEDGDPGTTDYEELSNKPSINGVELDGDKSFEDLGIDVFPEGGSTGDILVKGAGGATWETPATSAEEDNTRPITSAAVYTEIGNINALLATI